MASNLAALLSGERFNPYMMMGQSLTQTAPAMAQFDNPWASVAATGLSSLLGGALMGYGADYANKQDIAGNQRYLQAMRSLDVGLPQGLEAGMTDTDPEVRKLSSGLADALLKSDLASKADASKRMTDYKFDLSKMQEQSGLDLARQLEIEKKRAELKPNNAAANLPAAMTAQLAKSKSVIDEALNIAKDLDGVKSWTDLQSIKRFSGLDRQGVGLELKNLADRFARARTGAAMNASEVKLYNDLVGGDITAGPGQVANLLKKLADAESRTAVSELGFVDTLNKSGISGLSESLRAPFDMPPTVSNIPPGAVPTGKSTRDGRPIYLVDGVMGVFD